MVKKLICAFSIVLFTAGCKDKAVEVTVVSNTPTSTISIPSQFQGAWIRGSGSTVLCETDYDTDGDGTSTVSESQNSFFETVGGGLLLYSWRAYTNTGSCDYSIAEESITDKLYLKPTSIISESATSITLKVSVNVTERMIKGVATRNAANSYNTNSGACSKTDWVEDINVNSSSFVAGCGVVADEDGYDDFKFSNVSHGDIYYWRLTRNGSDLELETSSDNITYSAKDTYLLRP